MTGSDFLRSSKLFQAFVDAARAALLVPGIGHENPFRRANNTLGFNFRGDGDDGSGSDAACTMAVF